MSQELLYTSAPSGLNPTDQGFCTVVSTQGMPRNLKEFLESLSGYRQAEKPPHPVNYSHLIHSIAGKRYSVLSRVSDYEKDYSGRTNKLAHHVAFTMDELPASGPAALLGTSLFKTSWDGRTRWEPHGPIAPPALPYQGPCRTWIAITGDAGWAGVLAESAADGSNRPMSVIFPQGQNVLPLVSEALDILPREHAWTVSFSTYFTKVPAGVDCLWRFVLDGSPEAQQARAASHGRTIDLVELQKSRRPAPGSNPFVIAARAGRAIESQAPASLGRGTFSPSAAAPMPPGTQAAPTILHEAPAPPRPFAGTASAPASPFAKPLSAENRPSKLPYILGVSAVVLVIGVGVLLYSMLTKDIPAPVNASESVASKNRKTRTAPQLSKEDFLSGQKEQEQKADAQRAAKKTVGEPIKEPPKIETPVVASQPMETKVKIERPWDRSLKTLGGNLVISPRPQSLAGIVTPEPLPLARIHVADPSSIDLKVHSASDGPSSDGEQKISPDGFVVKVEDLETDEGQKTRRWSVARPRRHQVTMALELIEVGTFALSDQSLTFLWNMEAPSWTAPNSLLYSVLELSNGKDSRKFRLSQPSAVDPVPYDLSGKKKELNLTIQSNAAKFRTMVFLDLELYGVKEQPFAQQRMKAGDTAKFSTKNPSIEVANPQIEFEIQFEYDEKDGPKLILKTFTTHTHLKSITPTESVQIQNIKIDSLREPTYLAYFDRIKREATKNLATIDKSPQYKQAAAELPMQQRNLASLERVLNTEGNGEKRKELQEEIGRLKARIGTISDVLKRRQAAKDLLTWADEMESYFLELQNSARIGYALYIEIQGEKVYLARTKPVEPPKKTVEPANASKPPKKNDEPKP